MRHLTIILLLAVCLPVFGNTPVEQREERLNQLLKEIYPYVTAIGQDQKASRQEMVRLCQMVNRFNKELKEAKVIYGDRITTEIDPLIDKVVFHYQRGFFWQGGGSSTQIEIKKILADLTGYDILVVETNFKSICFFSCLGLFLVGLFLFVGGIIRDDGNMGIPGFVIGFVSFLVLLGGIFAAFL